MKFTTTEIFTRLAQQPKQHRLTWCEFNHDTEVLVMRCYKDDVTSKKLSTTGFMNVVVNDGAECDNNSYGSERRNYHLELIKEGLVKKIYVILAEVDSDGIHRNFQTDTVYSTDMNVHIVDGKSVINLVDRHKIVDLHNV